VQTHLIEIDEEELKSTLYRVLKEFMDFSYLIDRFIKSVQTM